MLDGVKNLLDNPLALRNLIASTVAELSLEEEIAREEEARHGRGDAAAMEEKCKPRRCLLLGYPPRNETVLGVGEEYTACGCK